MELFMAAHYLPPIIRSVNFPLSTVAQEDIPPNHLTALLAAHVGLTGAPSVLALTWTAVVLAVPTALAGHALVLPPRRTVLLLVAQ